MTAEFTLLLALATLIMLVPVVQQLRALGPRFDALRDAMDRPAAVRELRFTIREVVVHREDGNVVALPQRVMRPVNVPPLRAAA